VSIGLRLLARLDSPLQDPDVWLQEMETWVQQKHSDLLPATRRGFVDTYPTLFCQLHPAAEEIELSLIDPQHLVASANTSTVGPGYHIFVCSMLQTWARDFHASWLQPEEDSEDYSDEAGYFFTGNEQNVFDEMTAWLQTLAGTFFDGTFQPDDRGIALCLSIGTNFESQEPAVTPLGPRSREWLYDTSQDGSKGRDFFAWWAPGLNAQYFLGRALALMWTDVRWRRPANDSERRVLQDVVNSLNIANKLDPSLDYPWAEWAELLALLNESNGEMDWVRARAKGPPTIGYRRRNVTVSLSGGWQMRLPGSFGDFLEDEEHNQYALDPPKEIWFTSYSFTAASPSQMFESMRQKILAERPEFLFEREDYVAKAKLQEKKRSTDEKYFLLSSSHVCPSQRAVCTIVFNQSEERDWALEVWRSIQAPVRRET
jgi:hypothetical protein